MFYFQNLFNTAMNGIDSGGATAGVVQVALLVDIGEIERIGVGLILMGGAMTDDNDVTTRAQIGEPCRPGLRRLARRQEP